jgi:23S rRNA (cytosine1962-C5)-methyltransferase
MNRDTDPPRKSVTASQPPRLRLRVTSAAESILRGGHPWLFADSIQDQNRPGKLGELAVIFDRKDKFLAIGLFDPDSPIRLRVLHAGKPQTIDAAWWAARYQATLARRQDILTTETTGLRCINGESDGWPGLVLDRYGDTMVLKIYTAAWFPRLSDLVKTIVSAECGVPSAELESTPVDPAHRLSSLRTPHSALRISNAPRTLVLRLSRNIQALAQREFGLADGQILHGPAVEGPVVFLESGLAFEAEVLRGQKTGFFLDQRENRRQVETFARGRRVLNAFSFSGGFSLYAARGGATQVTDLDISAHALESSRRNFALNQADPAVAACQHERIQTDAFEWVAGNPERMFGLVILDPPSLAKREAERATAIRTYNKLAASGIRHIEPGGVLVACSCSAHVSAEEFFQAVRQAASASGRKHRELATTGHAPDHPATFKEAQYLKGIYLSF